MNLRIPEDLIASVRAKLQDPVRNKTKYGSVSELVVTLLYEWDSRESASSSTLSKL